MVEIKTFEERVVAEVQQMMNEDVAAVAAQRAGHEIRCLVLAWHLTMIDGLVNDLYAQRGLSRERWPQPFCICAPLGEPKGSA